ncbi:MAG: bile acid:sodium symporter family protein [Parashewanella sp.]
MEFSLIAKLVLPLSLALMMLTLGLNLRLDDFRQIIEKPKAFVIGLSLQLLLLPLVVWLNVGIVNLSFTLPSLVAAGFIVLAACPGGATSNAIAHLAGGNAALSISLTAVISMLMPLVLPISLSWQLNLWQHSVDDIMIPVIPTVTKLLLITVLPVILGMVLKAKMPLQIKKHQGKIQRLAYGLFFMLVLFMLWRFWEDMLKSGVLVIVMSLSICSLAMLSAWFVSKQAGLTIASQRTLMVETGIQNAATGMFIATSVLAKPELALIPLTYGIVMNLPAIIVIVINKYR